MNVPRETSFADVPRETWARLEIYVALLQRWNGHINLVGRATEADIWSRHVEDSLRLTRFLPQGAVSAIDLGSGAGLPGLIVAIATGTHVHLIEADSRKAAFLAEAARVTSAPVTVHARRIEDRLCSPASLIMSRALAPLSRLLELAHPMLATGGMCLFHKGRNVETEIDAARKHWTMVVEHFPSHSSPGSVILKLTEVTRV